MRWYQYSKTQLAQELGTNLDTGLSRQEAQARFLKFGPNTLPESEPESWVKVFFSQFHSPLIYILLVCAVIVYFLGQTADAGIIVVVVVSNAAIGAVQEGKSSKVLRSLKKLSQAEATVLREGVEQIIAETEVAVGDVLVLAEGQKVAADCRVVSAYNLTLDEAAFTGETGGVLKRDQVLSEPGLPVSGQHNMVFKGTNVLTGNGRGVVVGVGLKTELGKISQSLLQPEEEIPLQKNINLLSRVIIYVMAFISFGLFVLGMWSGKGFREMFALVVSLAVSIIPEGLPLVLTVILASGVWRMSQRNALVKKMQAVEALGQARVIAVDKTGTITRNQMVVKKVYTGGKIFSVTGDGYKPSGQAEIGGQKEDANPDLKLAALVAGLASKATVQLDEQSGNFKVSGDPTEAAMSVLAEKLGSAREAQARSYREVAEIPFDYKNKYRAVFYEHEDKVFCTVSGAPEVVLRHCSHILENGRARPITDQEQKQAEAVLEEFSSNAFRVVAFGFKYQNRNHPLDNIKELVFGGFYGIEDTIRPEAKNSVMRAEKEGVKIVMVTGDLKATARAIAREAGIFKEGDMVMTGPELAEASEEELMKKLPKVSVFARVTPEDKMKIIQAYKKAGVIVAMTGDGVNDAPSLVAADLGVAMGKIGTEVAKEAADIVLLDDNLDSIVAAIKEGRVMYENIKKSLQFLFSTSMGELFVIVAALIFSLPVPLTAVQILWMNLVTDSLIAAALALEKEEPENHRLSRSKYFLDGPAFVHIGLVAGIMTLGGLYIYHLYQPLGSPRAMTAALTLLCIFQWYNGLNCRFTQRSILNPRIFSNLYLWLAMAVNLGLQLFAVYNPFMQKVLKTAALSWQDWVIVLGLGLVIILAEETRKLVFRLNAAVKTKH